MTADQATRLVLAELERASAHHHAFNSGHEGYAVIHEELDELWEAVKAEKHYLSYGGQAAYEAVQVAAMALRFLVNLCDHESTVAFIAGRHPDTPNLFDTKETQP